MKLAIVGDYPFNRNKINGGVPTVTFNLVEGLRNIKDTEIYVVTCTKEITEIKKIEEGNVTLTYLPEQRRLGHVSLSICDVIRIRKQLDKIQPDVVHGFEQEKYGYAVMNNKFPTLLEVTKIVKEDAIHAKGFKNYFRNLSMYYMERVCFRKAKNILIISQYVQEKISSRTRANYYERYNPVRKEYFDIDGDGEDDRILFAGRVVRRKGVHILLDALKQVVNQFPKVELRIAGSLNDEDYYHELQKMISKNNLSQNVTFTGLLSEEELLKEYKNCSFVVMPSFYETFGNVAAQAMAAGKVVIASRVGGVSTYIDHNQTGVLVEIGNVDELAKEMIRLISNKQLRLEIGKQARKVAFDRFRIEIVAERNYRIYKELLR